MIIAIDGPAGAGKSTVARQVAQSLGFYYIDSGAMYRQITANALQAGINPDNTFELLKIAEATDLAIIDESVIRNLEVTNSVSKVAALPQIRKIAVTFQRQLVRQKNAVMEGRDIGTQVFPQAELKIFLTAQPMERARRRYEELTNKGQEIDFEQLVAEIKSRDQADQARPLSPLRKSADAVTLDTTGLTIEEVVNNICQLARERKNDADPNTR